MGNLRKSGEKVRSVMMISAAVSLVFAGIAWQNSPAPDRMAIDTGDAKAAPDRITAADALYAGRDDINKARVAVAALRQARTAEYSNYDAAWKLSRAAFYVGEHTENDSERDDM